MKSIIQKEKECYICGTTSNLQEHHCLYGTANRKKAEELGLKVWLCREHHTGDSGAHFDKGMDLFLKRLAQMHFEGRYGSRELFIQVFGKSYL